jgi:hypothetical protein
MGAASDARKWLLAVPAAYPRGRCPRLPKPRAIELTEDERARLVELARRSKTANAIARRARIVLAAADGMGNTEMRRAITSGQEDGGKRRIRNKERERQCGTYATLPGQRPTSGGARSQLAT